MSQAFDPYQRDRDYWTRLQGAFTANDYSLEEILINFPAHVRRRELARFIAHYELFKIVEDLPGCILEFGVSRGASFFTWSKLLETFCPTDRSRRVFGFDHFLGNQDFAAEDGRLIEGVFQKTVGGFKAPQSALQELNDLANLDNLVPGNVRSQLIIGDLVETLPPFLQEHPGLRISLLHLDVDLYRPTLFALELLMPLVVPGGVVVLDEYGLIPWAGESTAVDEYFSKIGRSPNIRHQKYVPTPHGYFVKDWIA